jgi:hypothetical protein
MKKIFLVVLLLSLFLTTHIFAQEKKANLLGLSIVEDILEDDYGLTILDGLFSITIFKNLPATDVFKVYSRWTGTGEHKVRVQIVDPDKKIIKKTNEENIKFENDYETYWFSHDFANTLFNKSGVYWVQAVLDDNVEFEMPLFIQISGEELEYKPKSNLPYITFSLPAIEVYEKDNGLLTVSGVFEYFAFEDFPAKDSFIIANGWCSGNGEFKQHIEILDPDNNIIYVSEPQYFENEPKTINVVYDELEDFVFPKEGYYTVKVFLEDEPVLIYPIIVEKK